MLGAPEIGVGMLGYAFMGKAHSNAFKKIAYMTWPPPVMPRLVGIAGRDADAVGEAAEPTIAAAQAGKHVVCEKPLGRDANESYDIWQAVASTGVKHLCAFN